MGMVHSVPTSSLTFLVQRKHTQTTLVVLLDLCRTVARQGGAVAVEEHHHDGRALGIEAGRDVQQHMVVAEGLGFQEHAAAEVDVLAGAKERMVRTPLPCRDRETARSGSRPGLSSPRHWPACGTPRRPEPD